MSQKVPIQALDLMTRIAVIRMLQRGVHGGFHVIGQFGVGWDFAIAIR